MAMQMHLANQMRMTQQMHLAPAMLQSVEILQLPIAALEQKIETELTENPVLELETQQDTAQDTDQGSDYNDENEELEISENNTAESFDRLERLSPDYKEHLDQNSDIKVRPNNTERDPKIDAFQNTADNRVYMPEYLRQQLSFVEDKKGVLAAAEIIIDNLNPKGYLPVRLEELANTYSGFDYDDFKAALDIVHQLDPPGIGARDLQECLLIQIEQNSDAPPLAKDIIKDGYEMLLANHLPKLASKLDCSIEQIQQTLKYISKLDTSPGANFYQGFENAPVRVDIIIEPDGEDSYKVRLTNSSLPPLRINSYYASMASDKSIDKESRKYLQENVHSAKNLIEAINQRKNTLLKIAAAVAERQKDFFKKGKAYLKPLFMQEIADLLGLDISTISRAVSDKYVQCPQGQIPLRDFFSSRSSDQDEAIGTEAAKQMLIDIIDTENKSKPYNDEQICVILAQKGCNISRRTVVKYRNQLNIPTSRLRKQYT